MAHACAAGSAGVGHPAPDAAGAVPHADAVETAAGAASACEAVGQGVSPGRGLGGTIAACGGGRWRLAAGTWGLEPPGSSAGPLNDHGGAPLSDLGGAGASATHDHGCVQLADPMCGCQHT